ncbi:MAG: TrkH family potassium uptake protein, partial [Oscillospiraceae bacterium]|nr:TrkH family potassium uptake protein [Oscillospiraceae bacterium]
AALGFVMWKLPKPKTTTIYARDGLVTVALSWIVLALIGALPFTLCGDIASYLDAVFEMISGFTTTGASILTDVESLNRCSLFWRSFSNWIGGMGILVFMLAIFRMEGGQAIHLLRAESPGPTVGKMVPRMLDSSKILYTIYFALTFLQVVCYLLGGMPVFDAFCNAFATAGTGGFSIRSASLGAYDLYAQAVTTIFMFLFGVNFSVYFFLLRRKFDLVRKNTELRWYVLIVLASIGLITLNILPMFESTGMALHHAAFSVSSIITTTGFATENFDLWPEFSRTILVFLMLVGACAGSTGGGLKVSRAVILFKSLAYELQMLVRPHTVKVIRMDGKLISSDVIRSVSNYFITYVVLMMASILLISLDNFDATTTVTSVFATFNNIGPGLGMVGPIGNYAAFSPLSKIVLSLDMLFGRLELYPMLVLLLPGTWTKK